MELYSQSLSVFRHLLITHPVAALSHLLPPSTLMRMLRSATCSFVRCPRCTSASVSIALLATASAALFRCLGCSMMKSEMSVTDFHPASTKCHSLFVVLTKTSLVRSLSKAACPMASFCMIWQSAMIRMRPLSLSQTCLCRPELMTSFGSKAAITRRAGLLSRSSGIQTKAADEIYPFRGSM